VKSGVLRFCGYVAAALPLLGLVVGLLLVTSPTATAAGSARSVHHCRSIENGLWSSVNAHHASCRAARPVIAEFVVDRPGRWWQTAPDGQAGAIQGEWKSSLWYCWAWIPFQKLGAARAPGGDAACFSRRHPLKVFVTALPNA